MNSLKLHSKKGIRYLGCFAAFESTISVGNNRDSDYNRQLLVQMARSTGGRFSSAHSFDMLVNALRKAS